MYYPCAKCKKHTAKRTKLNKERINILVRYNEKCFWCGHEQVIEGNWNVGYKVLGKGKNG